MMPKRSWSIICGLLAVFLIAGDIDILISTSEVPNPNFKELKNVPYLLVYVI
jgi:hypothetical protein